MYEYFKVLRRNATVYYPRAFGALFLGFTLYGAFRQAAHPLYMNYNEIYEPHPHERNEQLRQFHVKKNDEFIAYVTAERAKLEEKLKEEALQL